MPNQNRALQQAADLIDKVDREQILGAAEIAALSTALATVAAAFEQQTANLIAAFGQLSMPDGGEQVETFLGERVDAYALARKIRERLDLA
jgi:hypothetical protein